MIVKTKRKLSVCIAVLVLALASVFVMSGINGRGITVKAANVKTLEMFDNFDADSLGNSWQTANGVKYNFEYSALRLNALNTWGGYVNLQKQQLSNEWENFSVQTELAWHNTSSWSGIYFGVGSATSLFSNAKYFLHLNASADSSAGSTEEAGTRGVRLCAKDPASSGFYGKYDNTTYFPTDMIKSGNLIDGGQVITMKLDFARNAAQNESDPVSYTMTLSWGVDISNPQEKFVFADEKVIIGGFMGFTTFGNAIMEVRNFILTADGQTVLSDNFEGGSISYPSAPSPTSNWRCVNVDQNKVYCGKFCTVDFDGVKNGSLLYKNALAVNNDSRDNFEMSYDVQLPGMTESTYLGSGFGMTQDGAPDGKNFIGFCRSGDGYKMALIKNGEAVGSQSSFDATGMTLNLRFAGQYDGTVDVYVNDRPVASYTGIDFNGLTGVSAVSLGESASGNDTAIDNFYLYVFETFNSDNPDMAIDFKGKKSYESFGEMIDEHYVNTRKWAMYGGVKMPLQSTRNYVQFNELRGEVGFVAKKTFGDSIVRFDFQPSSMPDDRTLAPFGLSFGREYMDQSFAEAQGIYFAKDGAGTRIIGRNVRTASGATGTAIDVNVFADTATWYTCMIILSHRTAKVYVKPTAADDDAFGAAKITFAGVNTVGFTALTIDGTDANSYAYYNATNFSIVNLERGSKV